MAVLNREDARVLIQLGGKSSLPGDESGTREIIDKVTKKTNLLVTKNLVVDVLLGTAILDTNVRKMFPKRRRIMMTQGETIDILDEVPRKKDKWATVSMQIQEVHKSLPSTSPLQNCRVCSQVTLQQKTKTSVVVRSNES